MALATGRRNSLRYAPESRSGNPLQLAPVHESTMAPATEDIVILNRNEGVSATVHLYGRLNTLES